MKLKGEATSRSTSSKKTRLKRDKFARDYDAFADLKACQSEYEALETGYKAGLYKLLQRAAHDAKLIREDDELWQRFVGHAFWTKRNKNGIKRQQKLRRELRHALRYALIFMVRARTEEAKQLARKHARSVAKHLNRGVKIADLAETMSQLGNGIEQSSRAGCPKPKAPSCEESKRSTDERRRAEDLDGFANHGSAGQGQAISNRMWTFSGKGVFRKRLRLLKPGGTINVVLKRLPDDEDHDFEVAEIAAE